MPATRRPDAPFPEATPADAANDMRIACTAMAALQTDSMHCLSVIEPIVKQGLVTLTGSVDWSFQKAAAAACVSAIPGVLGVVNRIDVRPPVTKDDVTRRMRDFMRHAPWVTST